MNLQEQLEDAHAKIKILEARLEIRNELINELRSQLDKYRSVPEQSVHKSGPERVGKVGPKEHDDKASY